MRKGIAVFVLGFFAGVLVTGASVILIRYRVSLPRKIAPRLPPVSYSSFWENNDPKLRTDVVQFYRQYSISDPLVLADVRYIIWRATNTPDCAAREGYREVAESNQDVHRRLMARTLLGFSGPECGEDGSRDLRAAAKLARKAGRPAQAALLDSLGTHKFDPRFEDVQITALLDVPPNAQTMVLGETTLEIPPGARVATQVERVARDWLGYLLRWDLSGKPLPYPAVLDYHEGTLVRTVMGMVPIEVYPLSGTIVAQIGEKWFAPDETGVFRFEVLLDKIQYPTTHASGSTALVQDTHGASSLVSQVLERGFSLVICCGDTEGKAKGAYYLAQKGVNVVLPADRFLDLLLGHQGKGIVLGTAPVKRLEGRVVIGHQPVRFSLKEPIVVEDARQLYPAQYYDTAGRYFRRLRKFVALNLDYVELEREDQIGKVFERASQLGSTAVAVRVVTKYEAEQLREWLARSPSNRAILFHSGLYPFAQSLFEEYPQQVTFGDLRPRFE